MEDKRKASDTESETLLAASVEDPVQPGGNGPYPPPPPRDEQDLGDRIGKARRAPFLWLFGYYVLVIGGVLLLVAYVPVVRRALVAPHILPVVGQAEAVFQGQTPAAAPGVLSLAEVLDRTVVTLLVISGALLLVMPVAWVYMFVKRFRFDPALVRSVIILPIVVAGIAMVVKNSLALAFSLAGIVAAVRFRNTLKDPRDAVYIFLVIGIGLSAGVQALDVAMAMSLVFNLVVLLLWKYNVGSIYGGRYGRTGVLSVGDSSLMVAQTPDDQRTLRRRVVSRDDDIRTDGILLVHSTQPEVARNTVQEALSDMAKEWQLADLIERGRGHWTLEYLVRLKKRASPPELVGALDERWSSQVAAAEYIPYRTRKKKRKKS